MKQLDKTTATPKQWPIRALQFGEGNFLRAFVDWMLDIANEKGVTDIGVAVVPPRFHANKTTAVLQEQDCMYHVLLEGVEGGKPKRESRLVTSIQRVIVPESDIQAYWQVVESEDLRFVFSNTTEAGIRYEPDDARAEIPATFPGKVAALLHRRWLRYNGDASKGLIFVCCELIEDNGSKLRECVLRQSQDAGFESEFAKWVEDACIFCDTLVDRIVSGFPTDDFEEVKAELGYDDKAVVKGELYHIWAIGGKDYVRVRKELPLDQAGLNVLFMPSIKEFRDKKVRILNGSHTGMVPLALQLGCATVMDAFNNEQVRRFINDMVQSEVLPMIDGDRAELEKFAQGILERFYNPYIRHMLKSIALNSLSKWETRNWITAKDYYQKTGKHALHELFTLAALLALYTRGDFEPQDNAEHIDIIRRALGTNADKEAAVKEILASGVFIENFEDAAPGIAAIVGRYYDEIQCKGKGGALEAEFGY